MARSEHSTRRDPRDPEDLDRKRRIKRLVDVERARPRGAPGHGAAAGIPISTRDDGPYVHYPAGADDLRAILARVPHGTADGLGDIELCLDRTPSPDDGRGPVDPFLGLLTYESLPRVYSSRVLGVYFSGKRSRIRSRRCSRLPRASRSCSAGCGRSRRCSVSTSGALRTRWPPWRWSRRRSTVR